MLELPLDWNGASVEASEAQCLSFLRQRKEFIAKVLSASGNQTCGEMVSLPLCLLKVSCHISVYAATCYIAVVGSATPDQLPHFRRLHASVEVRLLFRSVLWVRLTSTAFPQLKPCFYNKLMPYQWICTSVASTHSCAGDGVIMSECLFVCLFVQRLSASCILLKYLKINMLKDLNVSGWTRYSMETDHRCTLKSFAVYNLLLIGNCFFQQRGSQAPTCRHFFPHLLSISMYAFGHRVTHRFHQIWGEHKENTLWFELESEWVFVCLAVRKLTLFRLGKGFGLIIS